MQAGATAASCWVLGCSPHHAGPVRARHDQQDLAHHSFVHRSLFPAGAPSGLGRGDRTAGTVDAAHGAERGGGGRPEAKS